MNLSHQSVINYLGFYFFCLILTDPFILPAE